MDPCREKTTLIRLPGGKIKMLGIHITQLKLERTSNNLLSNLMFIAQKTRNASNAPDMCAINPEHRECTR